MMEQVCVEMKQVEVTFLDRVVLDIPRLAVHQFDRIGIVGKNGAGKSTLLKLMAGQITPDHGQVNRFVDFSYFEQMATPVEGEADYELVSKLSVPKTEIDHLSGGEQTRLKLAHLFSTYQQGLLIDEPTTHLDADGIQFFIEELTYYYGALVLVSHDRYVLDQLVTKIWEVEDGTVTEYTGNYTDYVAQKNLQRMQQQEQHEKYVKEKNRLLKSAEEKMKKAEKITQANKRMTKKDTKAKANKMFMTKSRDTSQKQVHRAAKAIEQRVEQLDVVEAPKKEASCQFPLGSTIAITGSNGSGKTTLLRHIMQRGEGTHVSQKAVIGCYEQMDYQFEQDETVFAYVKGRSDYEDRKIRAALHAMSFTGNDLIKNVRELSGGEATRLVLCQLFLGNYNVLVLDEPTNFLDIVCMEALERFLNAYEGTVLLPPYIVRKLTAWNVQGLTDKMTECS